MVGSPITRNYAVAIRRCTRPCKTSCVAVAVPFARWNAQASCLAVLCFSLCPFPLLIPGIEMRNVVRGTHEHWRLLQELI